MNTCRDCQFLVKSIRAKRSNEASTLSWNEDERSSGELADTSGSFTPECARGIWSLGTEPKLILSEMLEEERGEDCFFVRAQKGMSHEGALALLARQVDLKRDQREKLILGIALFAVLVNICGLIFGSKLQQHQRSTQRTSGKAVRQTPEGEDHHHAGTE